MCSSHSVYRHFQSDEQEEERQDFFSSDYTSEMFSTFRVQASQDEGDGRYGEEYSTLFERLKCATMKVIQTSGAGNVVEEGSVW